MHRISSEHSTRRIIFRYFSSEDLFGYVGFCASLLHACTRWSTAEWLFGRILDTGVASSSCNKEITQFRLLHFRCGCSFCSVKSAAGSSAKGTGGELYFGPVGHSRRSETKEVSDEVGSVQSTTGPQPERTRKLRNEIDGFNYYRICSGHRRLQWES